MPTETIHTTCCIAGGGPAGMMLGFLLARAGDRCRRAGEARGLPARLPRRHHPSLDARADLRARPARRIPQAAAPEGARDCAIQIGDEFVTIGDLRHLPTRCKFIAFMPQWDFLDFLAEHGKQISRSFHLRMRAEATGLIDDGGRVAGVTRQDAAQDARHPRRSGGRRRRPSFDAARARRSQESTTSARRWTCCGFASAARRATQAGVFGHAEAGELLVMLDRGDYWQCAYVIPKGDLAKVQARGIEAFRASIVQMAPFLKDRVAEIASWDEVKLLTVTVDRLRQWHRPGCCASATPRMRCRRSAASASTSRFRTRSPPPTSSPGRSSRHRERPTICTRCRSGACWRCG